MLLGFAIATAVSSLCLLSKPDREPAIQKPDERPSQGDATPGIPVPPKEESGPIAMKPTKSMFVVDSEGVSSTPVITRKDQVVFAVETVEGETQHLSDALARFMKDDLPPGQPNTVAFVLQLPAIKTHSPEMTFNLFREFLKWREQQGDFDGVGSVAGVSLWGAEVGVWEYRAGTLKEMEAQKPSVPKHSASLSTEVGATE